MLRDEVHSVLRHCFEVISDPDPLVYVSLQLTLKLIQLLVGQGEAFHVQECSVKFHQEPPRPQNSPSFGDGSLCNVSEDDSAVFRQQPALRYRAFHWHSVADSCRKQVHDEIASLLSCEEDLEGRHGSLQFVLSNDACRHEN